MYLIECGCRRTSGISISAGSDVRYADGSFTHNFRGLSYFIHNLVVVLATSSTYFTKRMMSMGIGDSRRAIAGYHFPGCTKEGRE
jgi:hypothetical protein